MPVMRLLRYLLPVSNSHHLVTTMAGYSAYAACYVLVTVLWSRTVCTGSWFDVQQLRRLGVKTRQRNRGQLQGAAEIFVIARLHDGLRVIRAIASPS